MYTPEQMLRVYRSNLCVLLVLRSGGDDVEAGNLLGVAESTEMLSPRLTPVPAWKFSPSMVTFAVSPATTKLGFKASARGGPIDLGRTLISAVLVAVRVLPARPCVRTRSRMLESARLAGTCHATR